MIGGLRETARPAQLLMEMLWTEQEEAPMVAPAWGFAKPLLEKGYVEHWPYDETRLRITEKGREVARQLEQSPAGQAYKVQAEGVGE